MCVHVCVWESARGAGIWPSVSGEQGCRYRLSPAIAVPDILLPMAASALFAIRGIVVIAILYFLTTTQWPDAGEKLALGDIIAFQQCLLWLQRFLWVRRVIWSGVLCGVWVGYGRGWAPFWVRFPGVSLYRFMRLHVCTVLRGFVRMLQVWCCFNQPQGNWRTLGVCIHGTHIGQPLLLPHTQADKCMCACVCVWERESSCSVGRGKIPTQACHRCIRFHHFCDSWIWVDEMKEVFHALLPIWKQFRCAYIPSIWHCNVCIRYILFMYVTYTYICIYIYCMCVVCMYVQCVCMYVCV